MTDVVVAGMRKVMRLWLTAGLTLTTLLFIYYIAVQFFHFDASLEMCSAKTFFFTLFVTCFFLPSSCRIHTALAILNGAWNPHSAHHTEEP